MRQPALRAGVIIVGVCLLCGGLAAGAVLGTGVSAGESDVSSIGTDNRVSGLTEVTGPAQQADNTTANDTDRHRDPDEYGEDGSSEQVSSWLTNRLTERLGDSVLQVSDGQYEFARQFVGDEFEDRLGQLVEVDGETDDNESETAKIFNETRNEQQEFIDLLEQYNETQAEYQRALEAGNTERARALARELVALAAQIEDKSLRLEDLFAEIASFAETDLSESVMSIETIREDITTETMDIREDVFVETTLQIETNQPDISFLNPLAVTGQVQTAEGTRITNETIQLQIGEQTLTTEPDATGVFTISYRPVNVSAAAESLTIEYQPAPESIYLGSTAAVPVNITQVTPTFTNVTVPTALSFGNTGTIGGTVQVDDIPINTGPIRITLAGEPLGTASVANGKFETTMTVPAEIPPGDQDIQLSLPANGTAIAGTTATESIQIRETDTALSVDATETDASTIEVRGELTTANGQAVPGQPVAVSVDSVTVETVTTADDGRFTIVATLPEPTADSVVVQATYEDSETNLAASEATTELALSLLPTDETEPDAGSSLPITEIVVIGGGGLIIVFVLFAVGRLTDRTPLAVVPILGWIYRDTTTSTESPGTTGPSDQSSAPTEQDADTIEALITYADEQLRAGQPDAAVNASYAAVRAALADRLGVSQGLTHWEFYHKYRTTISENDLPDATTTVERLRTITDAYERATFDQQTTPTETAQLALDQAYRVLDIDQPASGADTAAQTDD